MAFGLGRLPSYGGVYSRAQKTWVNSIVRVGGKGAEREEGEKARRAGRKGGWGEEEEEEESGARKKRNKSKKQGGRRRQQSLVSRLIPLPPSHLIALSHATIGCVGVSGRLKKHGRLRPSIQKRTAEARRRDRERKRGKETE